MIEAHIFNQKLRVSDCFIVGDSIDYLTVKFNFNTADWNGYEKWATFKKAESEESYKILLTDNQVLPQDHLNLSEGKWNVSVHGSKDKSRITTNCVELNVVPSCMDGKEPFPDVPLSALEQVSQRANDTYTRKEAEETFAFKGEGGGGGGVDKGYVDRRDAETLAAAKNFTEEQLGVLSIPEKLADLAEDENHRTVTNLEKQTWNDKQPKGDYLKQTDVNDWAKQPNKPEYTAEEVGALPASTKIPSKTSDLVNDSNYLTEHQSLAGYATESFVDDAIKGVKVPTTLAELSEDTTHRVVTDDEKGLWNNKAEISDIPEVPKWALEPTKPTYTAKEVGALPDSTPIPTKTSDLQNDSGFLTEHQSLAEYAKKAELPTKTSELTNDSGFLTAPYGIETESADAHEIKANVFCEFTGNHANVNITLAPADGYAEYNFSFVAAPSGCNLSIPVSVVWDGGKAPTLEASKKYEVSIFGNVAVISQGAVIA